MEFEWDPQKAIRNLWKHDVSFEEASDVFRDPLGLSIVDDVHSGDEPRFIRVGSSLTGQLLVVAYTLRDEVVRIISAREATPSERRQYEDHGH